MSITISKQDTVEVVLAKCVVKGVFLGVKKELYTEQLKRLDALITSAKELQNHSDSLLKKCEHQQKDAIREEASKEEGCLVSEKS